MTVSNSEPQQVDIREPERGHDVTEGVRGRRGAEGKSAYDLAVTHGFQGTEIDWLDSLQPINGRDGESIPGRSAYELAVDYGFLGSVADWLNSLHGRPGKDSTIAGKDGKNGESITGFSAFEIACLNGYPGTQTEWILSLVGKPGRDGKVDASEVLKKDASEDVTGNLFVINKQTDSDLGQTVLTVASKPKWFGLLDFATPRRYLTAVKIVANALERRVQFEGAALVEVDGSVLLESKKMDAPTSLLTREAIEDLIEDKIKDMELQE